MTSPTILYVASEADRQYLPRLKALVGTASVFVRFEPVTTWYEIAAYAKSKGCTGIISSSQQLLNKLAPLEDKPTLDNYAGSYFFRDGLEIVFVNPLAQLVTVPYGKYVITRHISKLVYPERWNAWPEFSWQLGKPQNIQAIYDHFADARLIAVDIETTQANLAITSIAYSGLFEGNTIETVVIEIDCDFGLAWMRKFNQLPAVKIFQNGQYDNSYLLRYNAPVSNWLFDTATAHHAWLAELPKDLGTLQAFYLRKGKFWKDMSGSSDAMVRLEYNGRDTYGTLIVMCEWLLQAPDFAKTNYLQEFPLNYPALLSGMTGIKRDMARLEAANKEITERIATKSAQLDRMVGGKNFNVASPKQVKTLLKILGCGDLTSTDEKNLAKAAFRHPLIERITNLILDIRGDRKLISTYLTAGKELDGTILYSIVPHGTETGRSASTAHNFWCGLQVQNIPRGPEVKQTLAAYEGFVLCENDLEQAESRDTAYIAGSEPMIAAVSGTRDFHSVNCCAFFGVKYEDIYDDVKGKTLNKILRDIAKRVNHGANYNMGANTLVDTMGLIYIYKAANLLGLSKFWTPKQIAEFLLECFHKAYPTLKSVYYTGVIAEIRTTGMLVSTANHDSPYNCGGWVRVCFNKPWEDKRALNTYVAHPPQSLNAMTLNKAYMAVFYDIALAYPTLFRLNAQIHDSILYQHKVGETWIQEEVRKRMEIPVTVRGYDGKVRTFTVPAAIKAGKDGKGAAYWSETE